jgi:hypothetical protein
MARRYDPISTHLCQHKDPCVHWSIAVQSIEECGSSALSLCEDCSAELCDSHSVLLYTDGHARTLCFDCHDRATRRAA